jgi:hypothetical protein
LHILVYKEQQTKPLDTTKHKQQNKNSDTLLSYPTAFSKETAPKKKVLATKEVFMQAEEKKNTTHSKLDLKL